MCGIAGLILSPGSQASAVVLRNLMSFMAHRGPDGQGWLQFTGAAAHRGEEIPGDLEGQVFLLHKRLAILDLSPGGWQPMGTPDGRYELVFNGEIYNFLELREELRKLGHSFHSQSDSEVLLAAWAEWGPASLPRFVGMFAFALLDTVKRTVVLARDPFGIKPLYLTKWRGGVAFASEMKMLTGLPGFSKRADPQAVCDYLRFGLSDHGGRTFYADISELRPGHYMEIPLGESPSPGPSVPYWSPSIGPTLDISFEEAASRLREMFVESVGFHLRSDVPVGAALSGGIDSSAIVMAMRSLEPGLDLHAFTYVAAGSDLNEDRWASMVADAAGARIHRTQPVVEELVRDLDGLIKTQDAPFLSMSIYAQSRVFKLAAENGIKVMLDGQGADELLGGYTTYTAARLASLIRQGEWRKAVAFHHRASRLPGRNRIGLSAWQFLLPEAIQEPFRKMVREERWPSWINRAWFERHGAKPARRQVGFRDPQILKQQLLATLKENTLPMLLRYEDRNSMAYSIESRVPFLTPRLADFIFSLPESYLIDADGNTKAVFRKAMQGLVPDAVLDRKEKIGFETPSRSWLQTLRPWVEAVLNSEAAKRIPALVHSEMVKEWESALAGRRPFNLGVWRWVNLVRWFEIHGVSAD